MLGWQGGGGERATLEYNLVAGLANSTGRQGGEKKTIRYTYDCYTRPVGIFVYLYILSQLEYNIIHGTVDRHAFRFAV